MKTLISFFLFIALVNTNGNPIHEFNKTSDWQLLSSSCPQFYEQNKKYLKYFLTHQAFQDERQELGIINLTASDVSYLNDATDAMACREITDFYGPFSDRFNTTYYKSDKYYFVVNDRKLPAVKRKNGAIHISTGWNVLRILDQNFNTKDIILF